MKKILVCMLAAMTLLSCSSLKSGSTTTTATTAGSSAVSSSSNGAAAGKALRNLYTNYKAAGKFDYKDLNNIMNALQLVSSCKDLKNNAKNTSYWSSFAEGLISGSENLVTEQISNTVTTQLADLAGKIDTEKVENTAEQVKDVAGDITNLISLFK